MTPPAPLRLPQPDEALDWFRDRTSAGLDTARELVAGLRDAPPSGAEEVLRRWDEVTLELSNVGALASLLSNVHPQVEVRTACEEAEVELDKLATELRQDRALYDVFAALDATGLDATAARLLAKTLEEFRRSGVDQDDETRRRLAEISERITTVDQEFSRNIRDDVRTVRVTPDQLAGMPVDWVEAHPADAEGLITVTTDAPDAVPVRMFARDADVRRQVAIAFLERGWPDNDALLKELFDLRHEYANLVGYSDWASYDAAVKMIEKGPAIPEFIDRIAQAAQEPMERDLAVVMECYRREVPDAQAIDAADASYYQELVRKEQHDVDSQRVRTYFSFEKVRQGLLEVTGRLFGLRYEPALDAVPWHEDVAAYDVYSAAGDGTAEAGESLGRIYLDLHPREGKYKHAAQFTITNGVAGRQLPEGALVCNFSKGLMEHDHVVTLFHEFGHLVHHLLGGHVGWTRFAGVATEWDFVEAPSQMLEEWAWDAEVLQTFATDASGEPIPADLVDRMRAADDFGKGMYARQQMFYAAVSYWFHTERPADLTAKQIELQERYSPYRYIDDTHFFANFGHLGGYSSAYYTYMWSLVIAKDLFSAFDPDDLFAADVAGRYRDRVLAPGGTKDAADLVADFLGRPYTFDAYAAWLER
ncbi:MAG TPA: M3 family metallopeptidase [Nocardioides sp.]|uniref:M3 family metallopeptidase n=1 Tax=uncultured Nocardioides sp. TaxID=198441 RepID=UPI000EC7B28F|nr:M3 family metallopeptidase [uncultured Nocardioides sp.]HCB04307.1 peptidase M3 [Nocardioides sp.]HRD60925.1 M3 family metallopeptidase [Nocardioides sp.]HRI95293.1 M3 family metallopeptidase [Nocardioides sp.]HRK45777.1 M3 family metallopeptidase [Nocardioides sp.]